MKFQGQTTQFQLTDLAQIRTWPVMSRHLFISKVWSRTENICSSYRWNTSKLGKIEEIQGQITKFRLTNLAHIRTWPVFHIVLPISKVCKQIGYIFVWVIVATPRKLEKLKKFKGRLTQFRLTRVLLIFELYLYFQYRDLILSKALKQIGWKFVWVIVATPELSLCRTDGQTTDNLPW